MTCKERFVKEHPGKNMDFYENVFTTECPSTYGYLKDPDDCYIYCSDCWNREIPELDKTSKFDAFKDSHETVKAKCAELMKTNDKLTEENKKLQEQLKRRDDDIKILEGKVVERDRKLEAIEQILHTR